MPRCLAVVVILLLHARTSAISVDRRVQLVLLEARDGTGVIVANATFTAPIVPCAFDANAVQLLPEAARASAAGAAAVNAGFVFGIVPSALALPSTQFARTTAPTITCANVSITARSPVSCVRNVSISCTLPAGAAIERTRRWSFVLTLNSSTLTAWPDFLPVTEVVPWATTPTPADGTYCVGTIAGTGSTGFNGENLLSQNAMIHSPQMVRSTVWNGTVRVIVAAEGSGRIRGLDPSGRVITISGNGSAAFGGLNGPATSAATLSVRDALPLSTLACTAIHGLVSGPAVGPCMLIAASGAHYLLLLRADGILVRVAGNGLSAPVAGGVPATAAGSLYDPAFMSATATRVLIPSFFAHCVRAISLPSTIITTLAGDCSQPSGFSGDGTPATAAQLYWPHAAITLPDARVVISDTGNHRLRAVAPNGIIRTIAGSGACGSVSAPRVPGTSASLCAPSGLVYDDTRYAVWVATQHALQVLYLDDATVAAWAGTGSPGFAPDGAAIDVTPMFNKPRGLEIDASGALLMTEYDGHRVRAIDRRICFAPTTAPPVSSLSVVNASTNATSITAVISLWPYGSAPCLWDTTDWSSFSSPTVAGVSAAVAGYVIGVAPTVMVPPSTLYTRSAAPTTLCASLELSIDDALLAPSCQMLAVARCILPTNVTYDAGRRWSLVVTLRGDALRSWPSFLPLTVPLPWTVAVTAAVGSSCLGTVAGTGTAGFNGDMLLAINARVSSVQQVRSITWNGTASILISEQSSSRVRIFAADGVLRTFAGNGGSSVSGLGDPASSASISNVVDSLPLPARSCNAILAANNVTVGLGPCVLLAVRTYVLMVRADGILMRVAGDGSANSSGDGLPASAASVDFPAYMFASPSRVLIPSWADCVVRAMELPSTVMSRVAGIGTCGYSGDAGVATAVKLWNINSVLELPDGRVLIADTGNHRIRAVGTDGMMSTPAGNGGCSAFPSVATVGTAASVCSPTGMLYDDARRVVWITAKHALLAFSSVTGIVVVVGVAGSVIAGTGGDGLPVSNTLAVFNESHGIDADASGAILVGDTLNSRVCAIDRRICYAPTAAPPVSSLSVVNASTNATSITAVISLWPYGSAPCLWDTTDWSSFSSPTVAGASAAVAGYVIGVAPTVMVPPSMLYTRSAAPTTLCASLELSIDDALLAPSCQMLAVARCILPTNVTYDAGRRWSLVVTLRGDTLRSWPSFLPLTVPLPWTVTLTPAAGLPCIATIAGTGADGRTYGQPGTATLLNAPQQVRSATWNGSRSLIVALQGSTRIQAMQLPSGVISTIAGTDLPSPVGFPTDALPVPVAVCNAILVANGSSTIQEACMLISAAGLNQILMLRPNGALLRVAGNGAAASSGNGQPAGATAVALNDPAYLSATSTRILIACYNGHIVRAISLPSTLMSTVAGTGAPGFSGDGSAAVFAQLANPHHAITLPDGRVLITDNGNSRVRAVATDGIMFTIAGNGACGYPDPSATPASSAFVCNPTGLLYDDARNAVWITVDHAILLLSLPSRTIAAYAGSGFTAYARDGDPVIPGTPAFSQPHGLDLDPSGALTLSEYNGNRLRSLDRRICFASNTSLLSSRLLITNVSIGASVATAVISLWPPGVAPCLWNTSDPTHWANLTAAITRAGYIITATSDAQAESACSARYAIDDALVAPECQMLAVVTCTFSPPLNIFSSWSMRVAAPDVSLIAPLWYVPRAPWLPFGAVLPLSNVVDLDSLPLTGPMLPASILARLPPYGLDAYWDPIEMRLYRLLVIFPSPVRLAACRFVYSALAHAGTGISIFSSETAGVLMGNSTGNDGRPSNTSTTTVMSTSASQLALSSIYIEIYKSTTWQVIVRSLECGGNVTSINSLPSGSASPSSSSRSTATATLSVTASGSGSPTSTGTPSITWTVSSTGSASATSTPSASAFVSESCSGSATSSSASSASATSTLSASVSVSASVSASESASPSVTGSRSASPTSSSSPSSSRSGTPTPSTTASFLATRLELKLPVRMSLDAGAGEDVVHLSDSSGSTTLSALTAFCTDPCTLNCSTCDGSVLRATVGTPRHFAGATSSFATPADTLGAAVQVWVPFPSRASSQSCSVACDAVSTRGGRASARIAARVTRTRWPLVADLLTISSTGILRSARAPPRDVSHLLLAACPGCLIGDAVNNPTVVTSVLGTVLDDVLRTSNASTSFSSDAPFTLVINGNTSIIVAARARFDARLLPPFTGDTIALVGGVPARLGWVSPDGMLAQVRLPSEAQLCPAASSGTDCGYHALSISTASIGDGMDNATVSCPPFCPGDFPDAIPVLDATTGRIVPGLPVSTGPPVVFSFSPPSTGLYFMSACSASGYTDPASGVCTNASDARARSCAFGAGDACQPCPVGALCPGGYRTWPLPGFFAPVASSPNIITLCAPPASTRCLGWNTSIGAVQCGVGYSQGSPGCSACAAQYYQRADGTCDACPRLSGWVDIIKSFLLLTVYFLAVILVVYGVSFMIAVSVRAPTNDLGRRLLDFASWTFATVQTLAAVGKTVPAGIPSYVTALYDALAAFQFTGAVSLPPGCVPGYPLLNQAVTMSVAMLLLLIAVMSVARGEARRAAKTAGARTQQAAHDTGIHANGGASSEHGQPKQSRACCNVNAAAAGATFLRFSFIAVTLAYAPAMSNALSLLLCVPTSVTARQYTSLDGDGSALRAAGLADPQPFATDPTDRAGSSPVTVAVLAANSGIVCYESSHKTVYGLAVVTVACLGLLYPCLLLTWIRRRMGALFAADPGVVADIRAVVVTERSSVERLALVSTAVTPRKHPAPAHDAPIRSLSQLYDASDAVRKSVPLAPFVSADYRPSKYWVYAFDRFVLLALTTITVAWPPRIVTSVALASAKLVTTLAVLLLSIAVFVSVRPYWPSDAWKLWVKLLSLVTCVLAAALDASASLTALVSNDVTGEPTTVTTSLAYATLVATLMLLSSLVVSFVLTSIMPRASGDEVAAVARKRWMALTAHLRPQVPQTMTVRSVAEYRMNNNPMTKRRSALSDVLQHKEAPKRRSIHACDEEPTHTLSQASVRMAKQQDALASRLSFAVSRSAAAKGPGASRAPRVVVLPTTERE